MKRNLIFIGCMILGLLVFEQQVGAQARYDYALAYGSGNRDAGYRDAVDMDDWLERGHASVTESLLFSEGIRLTAWASEKEGTYEPGLASAIYYFSVPRWAQYLKISIRYKDAAQDDKIAGRLWIKSTENDMRGKTGADEEALFYGDTFVLRSEQLSETITVPSNRHVENGTIEMHIVVDGNDSIDVRDIRVEYLDTRPQITVVHRACDDYWDRWPRYRYVYHYYYWGPLFWPKTYIAYECWDIPTRFYWVTWRPWFFVNLIRVHHHRPWWEPRRYTVIYRDDAKHRPIERRRLLHQRLHERHEHATPVTHSTPVIKKTGHSPIQTNPRQNQEIRLKKEVKNPPASEPAINQNPNQRRQKEQPSRKDERRARIMVNPQTKTVERHPVVNEPDHRPASSSHTAPRRIQKGQMQPRTAAPQPRSNPTPQGAVQTPAPAHTPRDSGTRQEQRAQGPANIGQAATPQPRQETQQPRSHNEEKSVQTRTAAPQPQSNPTPQGAVQTPAPAHAPRDYGTRQEQTVQRPANIGQETMPQPRQETQQPRSLGGGKHH
ncbi:MAG: hypothetical protein A2Z08_09585 [Deltaproteobacteria bacterium RBG_16_54_11]|nr:MAG: hypothetical protein A2Z08_09585 [Deltaproteobacteria bacterium RBG_16_54_11]